MALTTDQAASIADSAIRLYEALQERGVDEELAGDWVQGAMMTLVMHEVEEAEPGADAAGPYELHTDHISPHAREIPGAHELHGGQSVTGSTVGGDVTQVRGRAFETDAAHRRS
jgi:hypothetical protein